MKKIVNGKLYDSSEATTVCSWRETAHVFGLEIEAQFTLCREKVAGKPLEGLKLVGSWGGVSDWDVEKDCSKGEFFLAVQAGGGFGKGRICPLSVDEARRLFEEHTDSEYSLEDTYEKFFNIRPRKPLLEQVKEAFRAGAEARQRQYEEEEAKKRAASPEAQ